MRAASCSAPRLRWSVRPLIFYLFSESTTSTSRLPCALSFTHDTHAGECLHIVCEPCFWQQQMSADKHEREENSCRVCRGSVRGEAEDEAKDEAVPPIPSLLRTQRKAESYQRWLQLPKDREEHATHIRLHGRKVSKVVRCVYSHFARVFTFFASHHRRERTAPDASSPRSPAGSGRGLAPWLVEGPPLPRPLSLGSWLVASSS